MANYDFIGFSFNGKHSIEYFGVYRTSDGSRYNDNLIPQLNDKTADIVGGDGQYYFGSTHKTRQFSISIAFDSLTEQKYREMRQWLDGKQIHDLVFDEVPYKIYSAKVTGTPQLKTVCFDQEGKRVYKGEGTIQFTCYCPYAHTPNETNQGFDGKFLDNYDNSNKNEWEDAVKLSTYEAGNNKGDIPAPFIVKCKETENPTELIVGELAITIQGIYYDVIWDSKTGLVTGKLEEDEEKIRIVIPYIGTSYGTLPVGKNTISLPQNATLEYDYWYY